MTSPFVSFLHVSMQMSSKLTDFVKLNVVNSAVSNDSIFLLVQESSFILI